MLLLMLFPINAVVIVDAIVADVFADIITVDTDFLAIVINVNDIDIAATVISADFVSLVFVIDIIVFDVAVVFAIDVIADNFFDIEIIVFIIFVVVDFTAIIIDFYLFAAVEVINVNVVVVVIAFFVVNGMIVDTGIVISICSATFSVVVIKDFCCFFSWINPSTASGIFDVTMIFKGLRFSLSSTRQK